MMTLQNRLVQPVGSFKSGLVEMLTILERGRSPGLAAMWVYMWGEVIADFIGLQE